MLSAMWKVVVKPFRSILHILNETLHQVTPQHIVDVMLQTQRATSSRILVCTMRVDRMTYHTGRSGSAGAQFQTKTWVRGHRSSKHAETARRLKT